MDDLLKIIERLENQITFLKGEGVRDRQQITILEKEVKEHHKKNADLERQVIALENEGVHDRQQIIRLVKENENLKKNADLERQVIALDKEILDVGIHFRDDAKLESNTSSIKGNFTSLAKTIQICDESVIHYVWQEGAITEETKQAILTENRNPLKRIYHLLDILMASTQSNAEQILYQATLEFELYAAADFLRPDKRPHWPQEVQEEVKLVQIPNNEMQDVGKEAEAVQGATAKPSQSKKVSIQSSGKVYHTSLCDEGISIDHASGMVEFNETDSSEYYGSVISAEPLNTDFASFSIEILHIGDNGRMFMGVGYWDDDTWCDLAYYNNEESIGGRACDPPRRVSECAVGDTMGCHLDIKGRTLTFLRNKIQVHTVSLEKENAVRPLHPQIHLQETGTAVKMMEIGPWRQ